MNVLLILCHPRKTSLNAALYLAFRQGLIEARLPFRKLVLADLQCEKRSSVQ